MKEKIIKSVGIILSVILIAIIGIIAYEIFDMHRYDDRPNEEYIAVLTDNMEDFEYIAVAMLQWEEGYLTFKPHMPDSGKEVEVDDKFYTNNQEIANEIENNKEFYDHLESLRELGEISSIRITMDGNMIEFAFGKIPCDYRMHVCYIVDEEPGWITMRIDDHWIYSALPNY